MRSYLDINSTVWNLIKKRFETEKITPNILDVGARNGIYILPNGYSENCNLIGFEPNKNEFEKLKTNKTPLQSKKREPKFFRKKYFNIALWKKKCRRNFYITIGEGASTLMGESNLKSDIYLFNEKKNYKDKHTKITNSYKINCDKIDNLYKNEVIDFIKLDSEGS